MSALDRSLWSRLGSDVWGDPSRLNFVGLNFAGLDLGGGAGGAVLFGFF